jgi:predicted O-linked N-acetylglucosamine transferase (SPINDLY family)
MRLALLWLDWWWCWNARATVPDGVDARPGSAVLAPADWLNRAIDLDRAGKTSEAHASMRQLADRLPDWDEPLARLADSQRTRGDGAAATETYRAVLALNPDRVAALLALGTLLIEAGEAGNAIAPLLRCCGLAPGNPEAWTTLGRAYTETDAPALALTAIRRAQRLARGSIAVVHWLVKAALAAGQGITEAARLEALSGWDPLDPALHLARGLILDGVGLLDPAVDALEAAVALAPEAREPIRILAGVLSRTARSRDAEVALRQAMVLDPTNPQLMNDHAAVLMRVHRHAEARDLLREVLWRNGPHPSVLCNLANATLCLGLQTEALELAHAAIALDPEAVLPRRSLVNTLPYQDGVTGAALLQAARDCAERLPRGALPSLCKPGDRDRVLTVGLLSGSLRTHPVGWLTIAGFEHIDPAEFQIVCLGRALEPGDPIAMRFHAAARSWENVGPLDDKALAQRARDLGVDILIDLGGHGDGSRMTACAQRLAPVQIKWVGMQNHSSGLPEMDWFLTDRWEVPPALEPIYSERMLRLPDGYVCYSPPAHAPDVVPAPVLRNGFVTFGCFNNIAKITPRAIGVWCEILQALPGSRLVLKTHQLGDAPTAARFLAAFRMFGIDQERVETRGSSPHRTFLANYNDIDLVLDPFPYSGGLTTCEALWMGVPTVTLPSEIFASRHSASHLSNAGFAEFVARDLTDYQEIALRWARDPDRLAALRAAMRDRVRTSPLCDAPRFGRALGMALRHAWTVR